MDLSAIKQMSLIGLSLWEVWDKTFLLAVAPTDQGFRLGQGTGPSTGETPILTRSVSCHLNACRPVPTGPSCRRPGSSVFSRKSAAPAVFSQPCPAQAHFLPLQIHKRPSHVGRAHLSRFVHALRTSAWAHRGPGLKVFTVPRLFCDPLLAAGQGTSKLWLSSVPPPSSRLALATAKPLPPEMPQNKPPCLERHWGRHWASAGSRRQVPEGTSLGCDPPSASPWPALSCLCLRWWFLWDPRASSRPGPGRPLGLA